MREEDVQEAVDKLRRDRDFSGCQTQRAKLSVNLLARAH